MIEFMRTQSDESRRLQMDLNCVYHTPEEIRDIFSKIIGREVHESFRMFPPFYTDFGKNIHIGRNVFINSCCQFQDQGGIYIDDGALIGHSVVIATLNHHMEPEQRQNLHHAPRTHRQTCVDWSTRDHSSGSDHRRQRCDCRRGCGDKRCGRGHCRGWGASQGHQVNPRQIAGAKIVGDTQHVLRNCFNTR